MSGRYTERGKVLNRALQEHKNEAVLAWLDAYLGETREKQTELAHRAGLSVNAVSRYAIKRGALGIASLMRLALATGASLDEMVDMDGLRERLGLGKGDKDK